MRVPTVIVHGTHDWICPPENVTRLKRFMPHATVHWVNKGTHTTSDPLIHGALRSAIRAMQQHLEQRARHDKEGTVQSTPMY